ncbi:hypothetical protein B0A48_16266 [Cryoendolithus antarcticus]|uniref:Major facilitator superfamily (MFS) profile domain-containing protein n=1 Tax=Cryoendolithus antarcticus TaxID=1507870 RepID=A0A1V8SGI7_9PEZI|nr:hypothetical protein B0A48_16266 [Cryoendolithus antarcticus]
MEPAEHAIDTEMDLERREQERRKRQGNGSTKLVNGGNDLSITTQLPSVEDEEPSEDSPLLPRKYDNRKESWSGGDDFAHLPWHKRPNLIWVLAPFLLMALAFGGSMSPKINLILQLVCKEYYDERAATEPGFTMVPVDFTGGSNNDQCRIPEVSSKVTLFTLWIGLISGLISAVTSPRLGALSDRYGRKKILIITSFGTIANEIFTIIAALHPDTFRVEWLLLGSALDGLTGSFIVAMAIVNAYATDTVPASQRNVAFGYIHGCLFSGVALGPILAGYIVKWTGKIVIIFYILLAVHIFFICFIALVVPESLSAKRQHAARAKHAIAKRDMDENLDWVNQLRSFNLFAPLKVLWPTGSGSSNRLRSNLVVLAAVDTIMFGVAMGSMTVVIIYTNYQFGWKTFESARFISIVNICRVFCLLVVMPLLTRLVRGKPGGPKQSKASGSDNFDLSIIRVAVLFDTLGYLGYTLARSGNMMILSGTVAAIGGIGSPVLQSALTKHVPADQTGQLLGASGLLHALARVVAPTIFSAIYAATVGKFTQTVFVCLTSTFGVAFLLTWFVRPHVYLQDDKTAVPASAVDEEGGNPFDGDASQPRKRQQSVGGPLVGAVTAAFASSLAYLGITSTHSSKTTSQAAARQRIPEVDTVIPAIENTPLSFPCLDKVEAKTEKLHSKRSLEGPEPSYTAGEHETFHSSEPILLDWGGVLPSFDIAYETWGTLNNDKSNAILLHTGLSASSHAHSTPSNPKAGWWERFIGPGAPIDTNRYFVICTNVLGGCYGSTGPSSISPLTGKHYGTSFPILTMADMVRAQYSLLDNLGINKLYASVGSSMGGMQSLAISLMAPERVGRIVSISGCARSHPYSIAMRHTQRQVLIHDPAWSSTRGNYYTSLPPHTGMKLAREIATITYRSGPEWEARFGRRRVDDSKPPALCPDFLIETYLDHAGEKWCLEFDANSLLYVSKAMDLFDLGAEMQAATRKRREGNAWKLRSAAAPATTTIADACTLDLPDKPYEETSPDVSTSEASPATPPSKTSTPSDLIAGLAPLKNHPILVLGVSTDLLFPAFQQREIANALKEAGNKDVTHVELGEERSLFGHDTFLLDLEGVGGAVRGFLG